MKYRKGETYSPYYDLSYNLSPKKKDNVGAAGFALAGALVADDATVIGALDDVAIPLVILGTFVYIWTNTATDSDAGDNEKPLVIFINGAVSPFAAIHGVEAIKAGYVNIGTIDRPGASTRRRSHLKGIPTLAGFDRDEFLPAVIKPAGVDRVSVKYVPSSDNRSAGTQVQSQINGHRDGRQVIVIPVLPSRQFMSNLRNSLN